MKERHFRAGVGTVIYNKNNKVAIFHRCVPPVGTWQFQQGGIDAGEEPETTLWRELQEETGLTKDEVELSAEYPQWTLQVYPPEVLNQPGQKNPDRLGQVHKWYFLRLKDGVDIDLTTASDEEFDDYKWVSWQEALSVPSRYKAHVYKELHDYFKAHLN